MSSFLLALQFLTIIPIRVRNYSDDKKARSLFYFPIIGLALGALLYFANCVLLAMQLQAISINVILVILLVIVTGGMHLDGLCDSADAFLSNKPAKEEMLAIMRDPHAGAMGIISIVSCLLLKIALLNSINQSNRSGALILACMLSRWAVTPQMAHFPYARQEGKAKTYIQGMNKKILILTMITTISLAFLIWHAKAMFIFVAVWLATYMLARSVTKKIGGITGDTLGATIELTEIIVLFSVILLERYVSWF